MMVRHPDWLTQRSTARVCMGFLRFEDEGLRDRLAGGTRTTWPAAIRELQRACGKDLFEKRFSRFTRQVVQVDALGALLAGRVPSEDIMRPLRRMREGDRRQREGGWPPRSRPSTQCKLMCGLRWPRTTRLSGKLDERDCWRWSRQFGHRLGSHVTALQLPFVVGPDQLDTDRRTKAPSFGNIPTTPARRFASLFSRSSRFVAWFLVRCWLGKPRCTSTSASLASMNAASLGQSARNWSARWRSVWLARARSGWTKARHSAAETKLCRVFGA